MNAEQWIVEAENRISFCRETIEMFNNTSSCDWDAYSYLERDAHQASQMIKFLESSIKIMKGNE